MELDGDLGFSRGPPPGTPDLNDDEEEDDNNANNNNNINKDNKEEDDNNNGEKLFFPKLSSIIPFQNHKLDLI